MSKRDLIIQFNPDAIVFEDLDDAIVGLTTNGNVVYDVNKIQEILYDIQNKGAEESITMDDIIDYVEFNFLSYHLGDFNPVYIVSIP